jgi:hypothetical protein
MALEGMNSYLQKKAQQLGLERSGQLAQIQDQLDELFPGQCRALSLNNGQLRVATHSSSVASELRFRQPQLLQKFSWVKKIVITQR